MNKFWLLWFGAVLTLVFQVAHSEPTLSDLKTWTVGAHDGASRSELILEGHVEALRDATLSSQVPGAVVSLSVKAGDWVQRGQELLRVDARAAHQQVLSSQAQMEAAKASLKLAGKELERQKQLFQKQYISQGALDRVQAQFESAQAQVQSLQAQALAAQAQSGFYVISAPFSGWVSEVNITLGDMAMPAKPLLSMYDPSALRITALLSQTLMTQMNPSKAVLRYEVTGLAGSHGVSSSSVKLLPSMDKSTHSGQLRLEVKEEDARLVPGMFAKVFVSQMANASNALSEKIRIPERCLVYRAEMAGVYVLDPQNKPRLRQVRPGPSAAGEVEILTGLSLGDRVVLDPAQVVLNK
jgi:RND family efflux transporter MFP subunit